MLYIDFCIFTFLWYVPLWLCAEQGVSTKSLGDLLMIYRISSGTELRTLCETYVLPLSDRLDPKESSSFLLFILLLLLRQSFST